MRACVCTDLYKTFFGRSFFSYELKFQRGGVHSSRIKCKGVQFTQINWQDLKNLLKTRLISIESQPKKIVVVVVVVIGVVVVETYL